MTSISLNRVKTDGGTQPRAQLDLMIVADYAEAMKDGAQFPPVILFYDGETHWLADGFHRYRAAEQVGQVDIDADIKQGTRRDAVLFSVGANSSHGLRRTNEDKRRSVMTLLEDDEWRKWSDREIARWAGVSQPFVSTLRPPVTDNRYQLEERTYTTKHGTTATMQTANIGRAFEPPTAPPEHDLIYGKLSGLTQSATRQLEPYYEMPKPKAEIESEGPEPEMHPFAERPTLSPSSKPVFNRTNDNIEWAHWTWNPVTGCKFGCTYCYARDIANRFYAQGFEPTYHPERLAAPKNTPLPAGAATDIGEKNVFVCSMADLFGGWVPNEWIDSVMDSVRNAPQWNFLFLTKNPKRLAEIDWPDNAWVGTTVDTQKRVNAAVEAFKNVNARVRFLSLEPLKEHLVFPTLECFDWVIIGGQSRSSGEPEFQPDYWWAHEIAGQAHAQGCKVYFKPNLTARPREYPDLLEVIRW